MKIIVVGHWVCAAAENSSDRALITTILRGGWTLDTLALHEFSEFLLAESFAEELRGDLSWLNDEPEFWGIATVPEELRHALILALRGATAQVAAPQAPVTFSHCQSCRVPYPYGEGPRECRQCAGLRAVFS